MTSIAHTQCLAVETGDQTLGLPNYRQRLTNWFRERRLEWLRKKAFADVLNKADDHLLIDVGLDRNDFKRL